MDKLASCSESIFVSSHGVQADSIKRSNPSWTLPKASRDEVKKVFLSKDLSADLIGRDSPGFNYSPKRQLELPKWGFGTARQRPLAKQNKYNEPYNDLIGNVPDSQAFKYQQRSCRIGTCARDVACNSPDFCGFPPGTISPGPQRYNPDKAPPCFRLAHAPGIDNIAPSFSIRQKTKILEHVSQTGAKVGPGVYPLPDACGEQPSSVKPSLPRWNICKQDRFQERRKMPDAGRLWDGMKDQKEKNCRAFNSAPSFSFGTSTRGHQQRVARCQSDLDKGPSAKLGRLPVEQPNIAPRKEIVKYSGVFTF